MKKTVALSFVLAATLGLAACSEKPAENVADANVTAADLNATAEETIVDTNAAIDNVAEVTENAANAL